MARPTGWDILGMDGDPTPGVVETVQALAKQFGDFAHDVEAAYGRLNSFGSDATALSWVGQTAEAFKGQFGPLPGRLQKLYISYSEASDALSAYVPKLQAAQSKADSALRQAQDANVDLQRATNSANNAAADLKTAQQNHTTNPNPQTVADAQTAHDTAQSNLKNAQARMDALKAQAHQAHDDLVTAGKDCAKALHHAQHDGIHNKHWWQHVGEALSEWGGKIAEVAGEIAPVLDVLAIATSWIPGVDVVTAGLAEADNMVALFSSGLQIAGDTMQGHYGDALMGAGMLGAGFLGGKALGAMGGKVLGKIGGEAEEGAEDAATAESRAAERDGGDVETETAHDGGENIVGEDVRTAEGNQEANVDRDPVDVVSGWMLTDATDVELPGVLPLVLRRAYASGYATGRLFGPGWASTLDQRLSINAAGIHFAGDDAQRLDYPIPDDGQEVLPGQGARWPLVWDHDLDEIRIIDPWTGHVRHFATVHYSDGNGQIRDLTAITDRNHNRINILRDADGTPTAVEHPGYRIIVDTAASPAGPRITALQLVDADTGYHTTLRWFHYDGQGRLSGVMNSSDLPFAYEWDGNNRITAWQDRSGYRYEYTYDHLGRVTHGDGAFLAGRFAYDPANRTTIVTDSLGYSTTFAYDEYGHVRSETNELGESTFTTVDPYGRILSRTDPLGHTTTQERNSAGDITRIIAADGSITELEYNQFHEITAVTGSDGARWLREYDDRGNLTSIVDPAGAVSSFEHTPSGALIAVTDQLGAKTRYLTDAAGLPVRAIDPLGNSTEVMRDNAGRVVRLVNSLGAITTFEWDPEGRPVSRTEPDGAVTRWEYDSNGQLVKMIGPAGATTIFEPGPLNTVQARTGPDGLRHAFAYDSELHLVSVTNHSGASWNYTYDPAGRLKSEDDFAGRAQSYEYDRAGHIVARVSGSGERIGITRDRVGRITGRHTPEGEFIYRYDAGGRLIAISGPDVSLAYERDLLGRVLAETVDDRKTSYTYDAAGRLIGRVTASGAESRWTFDPAGRPTGLAAGTGHLSLMFNAAGQEVQRVFGPGAKLSLQYDTVGRPIAQHVELAKLIGDNPSVDGPGSPSPVDTTQTVLARSWTWRADNVPVEIRDSLRGSRRIASDIAGRVTAVTAHDWSETYAYDAFGNPTGGDSGTVGSWDADEPMALTPRTRIQHVGRVRYEYDNGGRLVRTVHRTLDGRRKIWRYSWDSQDRLIQADTPDHGVWRYGYDPLGRRTRKYRISGSGQIAEQTVFTWDGVLLAEESTTEPDGSVSTLVWDYEPYSFRPVAQRRHIAVEAGDQSSIDEAFYAIVTDLVGTPTELVTSDGRIAWHVSATLWGKTLTTSGSHGVDCPLRFPGQYYDAETGLHYNLNRYYDPEAATYLTPDPLGLAPSPNDRSYVLNPLIGLDPLGLYESITGTASGSAPLPQYGPFHRLASPTQTEADTQTIIDSGELWGGPGRFSDTPMVQAHRGPLPEGKEGFEFYTDVAPNPNDVPHRANWSSTRPGVTMRHNEEYASIPIVITRVSHGGIQWARSAQ